MNQISVIVPIYNMELYLEECLESIVNQTEDFYEIILVDDGSIDSSNEICERYCRNYSNIRLITQKNQGLSIARNVGMSYATGDYIIFVDSDDYIYSDMNEIIRGKLSEHAIEILYYNADIQYDINTKEPSNAFKHKDILNEKVMSGMEYFRSSFPDNYIVCAWVAAYKKEFLEQNTIQFPEGIFYEDNFFTLQTITNAVQVMCISNSLYVRRCRENSITTSEWNEKKCCDIAANQRLMWNYIANSRYWKSKPELSRQFVSQMLLNAFYNISKYEDKMVVNQQKENLTIIFLEKWLHLFLTNKYSWSESLLFILILNEIGKIEGCFRDGRLIKNFFGTADKFVKCKKDAKLVLERDFMSKLSKISMNESGTKVGIYGTGTHTVELIKMYEKYVSPIKCELVFIVTACGVGETFYGQRVVRVLDILDDIDCIVLSSMPYQQEMKDNLMKQGISEDKIFSFYKKEDICDLIMVNWVLCEIHEWWDYIEI